MRRPRVLAGKGWALLLLTAVELVVFLDTTALNVALPQIGRDLGLGEAQLGWVTNAYILAFGGFMLVGGRAADLLGPRRVFMAGLTAFTIASAFMRRRGFVGGTRRGPCAARRRCGSYGPCSAGVAVGNIY